MAKKPSSRRKGRRPAAAEEARQPVVSMISLGCAKNTVDSERVLGMLAERGFVISADPDWADVVLVNTCAFIAPAREETEKTLRELCRGNGRPRVVALGCYPERASGRRRARVFRHPDFPAVDAFVGFESYDELPALCAELAGAVTGDDGRTECRFAASPRLRLGSPATAYLKIAEGCSNRCRYCTIPSIRGPLASVPMEELLEEAGALVRLGARELCVIAQDTASYGADLYGRPRLPELLKGLCRVRRLRRVRLLYVHPAHLTDEILEVMAGEKKVCRYIDLPLQHVSDPILQAMGRRHTGGDVRRLMERVRSSLPGAAVRTSMIVGFPGETAADFRELREFVRDARFDHLGVFTYSREKGTPAARLGKQVPASIAKRRRRALMRLQQGIAFEGLEARVGGVETAMLELPRERAGEWLARTGREAPEVDGNIIVRLPAAARARPGDVLRVRIDSRSGYDLVARPARRAEAKRR